MASAFGQHGKFPPHAGKTSGTQGIRRTTAFELFYFTFTLDFFRKNKRKTVREIRLECVHRGQTLFDSWSFTVALFLLFFLISRRDGENNGFLAGVPLLPPPSRVVSHPNSLSPFPFERLPRRLFKKFTFKQRNLHLCVFLGSTKKH